MHDQEEDQHGEGWNSYRRLVITKLNEMKEEQKEQARTLLGLANSQATMKAEIVKEVAIIKTRRTTIAACITVAATVFNGIMTTLAFLVSASASGKLPPAPPGH